MDLYVLFSRFSGNRCINNIRENVWMLPSARFFVALGFEHKKGTAAKRLPNRYNKGETVAYWPSVDDTTIMDENSFF